MKIKHNGKTYRLNEVEAIKAGIMKELKPLKSREITITPDEAAVLSIILGQIGGSSDGARGKSDSVSNKIHEAFGSDIIERTDLDLTIHPVRRLIYFEK